MNFKNILIDSFGRSHSYLRVSLTERCNLRCSYCMPEEGVQLKKNDEILSTPELLHLIKLFVRNGVKKVRFTGGEPLVRKDFVDIVKECGKIEGLEKIGMTTNGVTLERKLKDLKEGGMNQINISLDTLKEKKFEFISKRKGWSKVMKSIDASIEHGFSPVKVIIILNLKLK
jgi:molybdenum cofactor biosynthesis enzyme MoaA